LTKSELEYLVEVFSDREEALKELFWRFVRTRVLAAVEKTKCARDKANPNKWKEYNRDWICSMFHLFEANGVKALTTFRYRYYNDYEEGSRLRELQDELVQNQMVLDMVNRELWIVKGLKHRFKALLCGKMKGRLDIVSDMARDYLERVKPL